MSWFPRNSCCWPSLRHWKTTTGYSYRDGQGLVEKMNRHNTSCSHRRTMPAGYKKRKCTFASLDRKEERADTMIEGTRRQDRRSSFLAFTIHSTRISHDVRTNLFSPDLFWIRDSIHFCQASRFKIRMRFNQPRRLKPSVSARTEDSCGSPLATHLERISLGPLYALL